MADSVPDKDRFEAIGSAIQKRNEEQKADHIKKQEARQVASSHAQNLIDQFASKGESLQSRVENCSAIEKENLVAEFDAIAKELAVFEKFVSDNIRFIPPYDAKRVQQSVVSINVAFQEAQTSLIPKKKFGFKNKKKVTEKSEQSQKVTKEYTLNEESIDSGYKVKDRSDTTIEVPVKDVAQQDVILSNLTNCTVKIKSYPSTVHMANLRDCTVLTGPVSTSVFLDDCVGSTFVLACQQLRIHNTKSSSFYTHITSRAIIEDTEGVGFAPYSWCYKGLDEDFARAGLSRDPNNWNKVDDFNWLASDKNSPNWSIIADDKRKEWDE